MAEKLKELEVPNTVGRRLKNIFMGGKRPGIITRVFFWSGLAISWGYFFIWYLVSYISLLSINGLLDPKPESRVRAYFIEMGETYGIQDAFSMYRLYCLLQVILLVFVLLGLFFTWRRWKTGPIMFVSAHLITAGMTIYLLSWAFYMEEVSWFDKIVRLTSVIAAVIVFNLQKKRRKKVENRLMKIKAER